MRSFPTQFFLSNQRVSTSPVNLPKCGAHRVFQNPKDIERWARGFPPKLRAALAPQSTGISRRAWHPLSLLSFVRLSAGTCHSAHSWASPPSTWITGGGRLHLPEHRATSEPGGVVALRRPFLFLFFTWIKAQSCVNHTLSTSPFIPGLGWAISFPTLVPLPLPPGTLPAVDTDPYMYMSLCKICSSVSAHLHK